MLDRRSFLEKSGAGMASVLAPGILQSLDRSAACAPGPVVIATWALNVKANAAAWSLLGSGGHALDAVEAGVRVAEADPEDNSVGYGGLPDRDGRVTLDACIMDHQGRCGSVLCMEHIVHAVSVARKVMEETPHIYLAGPGALAFALEQGFEKTDLLTEKSRKSWQEWLRKGIYRPMQTVEEIRRRIEENHDTIGMLALDRSGHLSGACSTSGLAFKRHGRVGDSPILGAGLFVDNEVGAATATGMGEEVVRICGAHTVVEAMRYGMSPEAACKEAVRRIIHWRGEAAAKLQVGFIALHRSGVTGAYAIQPGFSYVIQDADGGSQVYEAPAYLS